MLLNGQEISANGHSLSIVVYGSRQCRCHPGIGPNLKSFLIQEASILIEYILLEYILYPRLQNQIVHFLDGPHNLLCLT